LQSSEPYDLSELVPWIADDNWLNDSELNLANDTLKAGMRWISCEQEANEEEAAFHGMAKGIVYSPGSNV